MTYFESLGDGFYCSPVEITISGMDIQVYGQIANAYAYSLIVVSSKRYHSVVGADKWNCNKESGQIIATKKGICFESEICIRKSITY